jgi:hypothetical protein
MGIVARSLLILIIHFRHIQMNANENRKER